MATTEPTINGNGQCDCASGALDPIAQLERLRCPFVKLAPRAKHPAPRHNPEERRTPHPGNWVGLTGDEARAWVAGGGNYGAVLGYDSRLMVVDQDGGDLPGPLPDTVTAKSGREGGRHYYLRVPEGIELKSGRLSVGVDAKSEGGYIVGPGSTHPNGNKYEFLSGRSPNEIPVAECPQWIIDALTVQKPSTQGALGNGSTSHNNGPYLDAALRNACDRVRAETEGNRNDTLNKEAYSLGGLPFPDKKHVAQELLQAALDAGLSERESRRTIESGLSKGAEQPRDVPEARNDGNGQGHTGTKNMAHAQAQEIQSDMPDDSIVESPTPVTLAKAYYKQQHPNRTLRCHKKTLYMHDGTRFAPLYNDDHLRADISRYLQTLSYHDEKKERKPIHPRITKHLINNVIDQLKAIPGVLLPDCLEVPAWIDESIEDRPPAKEFVSMKNGLLHLPTRSLWNHTPDLFCTSSLPFDYAQEAMPPEAWIRLLNTSLPGVEGEKHRLLLQEFIGYCLGTDTKHDKLLWLIGDTRSGKGTILRTLIRLLGNENVATPTIGTLGSQFGLEPLLEKRLAITGDARFPQRYNPVLMERLLSLTGNDSLDVDRKGIPMLHGVRFNLKIAMASNKPPALLDTAGALAARVLAIDFPVSFAGREDQNLENEISKGIDGVFNWALDGYDRLQKQGKFTHAESNALQRFRAESNSLGMFVPECCILNERTKVKTTVLYEAFAQWCDANKKEVPGDESWFGKQLQDNYPSVQRKRESRPDENGRRGYNYHGINLK